MAEKIKAVLAAVNAKFIHSNLALNSLRMYAAEFEDQIGIAEFTINQPKDIIIQEIYRKKPDLLAFSCYIWNIEIIGQVSEILHMLLPDTPIWLGGPEVSFHSEALLKKWPWITGIMQGEGEKTFQGLMRCYTEKEGDLRLHEIPGIVFRDEDGRILAGRPVQPSDLVPMDDLPFIYYDLEPFKNKILYYETSRGCPFSCSYCLSSAKEGVRLRSLNKVLPELQFFLDAKVPQVKFVDRTFNCAHQHAMAIWQYIYDHDNGVTNFHFEIEANVLTEDEIALLMKFRPGLAQMEIGVQSSNPETLKAVHRNPDLSKIADAAMRIHNAGNIHLHLDLIAGLPWEDYQSFRESFNTVYRMHPNELQLGFLKMLKGSPIEREADKFGIISSPQAPYEVLRTSWLSYDDLLKLKDVEEVLEVYSNSQQFSVTMQTLAGCFPDPWSLFEALSSWYRANGLFGVSHSRMERFALLRRFILETGAGQAAEIKERSCKAPGNAAAAFWDEHLIMDLYLRENAKSRPDWAASLKQYHLEIRDFYRLEAKEHRFLEGYEGYDSRQLQGMTHLEYFRHLSEKPVWILFDYRHRDPLTGDARTVRIPRGLPAGLKK